MVRKGRMSGAATVPRKTISMKESESVGKEGTRVENVKERKSERLRKLASNHELIITSRIFWIPRNTSSYLHTNFCQTVSRSLPIGWARKHTVHGAIGQLVTSRDSRRRIKPLSPLLSTSDDMPSLRNAYVVDLERTRAFVLIGGCAGVAEQHHYWGAVVADALGDPVLSGTPRFEISCQGHVCILFRGELGVLVTDRELGVGRAY
ncbi:hypothetical protein CC86DRAFT_201012 [Ophiobolus disseminans]|uniref:Uncharacterized protein n=1 Tax=Ophiobolus disseminans TaxID=1469910 RepID=A0A6A7A4Z8_9PLEO|nr:hypothetical protein CC86DRAFT_201012 [Ophiobolus disseminans]